MDLEDLDLFVRVVREGSLSRAARSVGSTQPTVSRRIQRLEAEVGQPVLDRSGRAVSPTRVGLALLRFAERLDGPRDALARQVRTARDLAGELVVGASTTPAETFVPGLVAAFCERHPGLVSHLQVMDSLAVESCVEQGVCHVGFVGHQPRPGLTAWHIVARDEVALAVGAASPLAAARVVSPSLLLEQAFVERPPGSGTRRTVEAAMAAAGIAYPSRRVVMEVSTAHALLAMVGTSACVGFVSRCLVSSSAGGTVVGRDVDGVRLERSLYLIHPERRLPPPAAAFRAFVLERRGELPGSALCGPG